MRRTLIAVVTALTVGACGGDDGGTATGGTDPSTDGSPSATTRSPAATETAATTPFEGTWAAPDITPRDIGRAIDELGFGDAELEVFLDEFQVAETLELTWKVQGASYTMLGTSDGEDLGVVDRATISVDGDTVTYTYAPGGTSTLRWAIEGDRLEMELLEDTQPDTAGVSTSVYVAALYTSVPWERVAS